MIIIIIIIIIIKNKKFSIWKKIMASIITSYRGQL